MEHKAVIYNEVMSFCRKCGLIEELEKSLLIPESKRFDTLNIEKSGLEVLDAVHCLHDARRTNFFIEEIGGRVSKGSIVLEAGIGTGILSFYAASLGATVFGCEINPAVFALAQEIKGHLEKEGLIPLSSVEFFLQDATTFVLPRTADVLISENIYTGMFFEYQVQIMNNLLKYLNTNGVCIPQKVRSFFSLTETTFPRTPSDKELFIPYHEGGERIAYVPLSAPYQYDEIDFTKVSRTLVDRDIEVPAQNNGLINSFLVYSEVIMPSGKVIRRTDTEFLNNEILIAIDPPLRIRKGERLQCVLQYPYGGKPQDAKIEVKKLWSLPKILLS